MFVQHCNKNNNINVFFIVFTVDRYHAKLVDSNTECMQIEFEFRFHNQSSKIQTSFNIPNGNIGGVVTSYSSVI